jgi:hypothetical protein
VVRKQAFFVKPTIRELARLVDGLTHGDDVIAQEPSPAELEREAVLPDDIVAAMNCMALIEKISFMNSECNIHYSIVWPIFCI